jgi:hypothetical protein
MNIQRRTIGIASVLLCVVVALGSSAFAQSKTYVIMAKGQGNGSTSFAPQLGSSLVRTIDDMGLVIARSSDPNFATWAAGLSGVHSVTEDVEVQWLPDEPAIEAGVTPELLPPANAETFSAVQWNLHQIHADQTAANGDRGNGVARARVAVLDSGIIKDHIILPPISI